MGECDPQLGSHVLFVPLTPIPDELCGKVIVVNSEELPLEKLRLRGEANGKKAWRNSLVVLL
jgi:hypothetical protein